VENRDSEKDGPGDSSYTNASGFLRMGMKGGQAIFLKWLGRFCGSCGVLRTRFF